MTRALVEAIEGTLGAVRRVVPLGGGERPTFRVELAGGAVFAKTGAAAPDAFAREAEGLAWLGASAAIRVPQVRAVLTSPAALLLEWIEVGPSGSAEALGRGLAAMHRAGAPRFGRWSDDGIAHGYLASIRTDDAPRTRWDAFYGEARLRPLLVRAWDAGLVGRALRARIERVIDTLAHRVGPSEPPARLHGDLWSGNALWDARGAPVLVDPAAYGGHREVDLAMMRLFGGFPERTFAAYDEAFPLAPGHEERVPLYQLLPLLAHVALFGAGYVGAVERAVDAIA